MTNSTADTTFSSTHTAKSADLPPSIFSVDVEDWFHILDIPGAPQFPDWKGLPSRVERNFAHLLDLFSNKKVTVTCFFLGWVAERFPHLVREAAARGHEIASHGYAHRLVYELTRDEFHQDALRTRELLEDIAGVSVLGYRAAGFSVTDRTPWFFETLVDAGYQYDSSLFPTPRGHGGMRAHLRAPHLITCNSKSILEFPITLVNLLGKPLCFFGGGYLRLYPYWLVRHMSRRVVREGRPVVFYIHPREIDLKHPRLPMPIQRRFKSYINLSTTEDKLLRIFDDFPVATFRDFLSRRTQFMEA